jgi:hypothetical protein
MVDTQAGIPGKRLPKVFPERVDAFARVKRAQGVKPAQCGEAMKGGPDFGAEQGVRW